MNKKTINILYWVFTLAFSGLMIYSSVGGIGPDEKTKAIFHGWLGYPVYFIQLISWAKIIGSIAILIPGFNRIKEWAYAGLFFDLGGAVFSALTVAGSFDPRMLMMLIWILPGLLSYILWHQTKKTNNN